ncbi:MAG: toll/interleukin-1 receptor domain-containing protein [Hyphomonadaceae bacterium]|nr:toll/interleukin-1 receptor domain-containing protein [Hyphomonadaceae bacterium]
MSYDVFVVAALEDRDMAKLVTRRLRGLKMRVWYDAKSTDDVFDAKESRAIDRSKAMIVLWSENAVNSSFVRAAAGQGYSKIAEGYPFIQAALDDVVPYEPYSVDTRHDIAGFTSRTNTEGWFEIVSLLEKQQGRKGLKDWLLIPTKDREGQDAWRDKHPDDPLAQKGQPVGVKKTETKTGAAAAATTAAAATATVAARAPTPEPAKPKPEAKPAAAVAAATPAEQPAEIGGNGLIWWMLAAIAVLFLLAYLVRTLQATPRASLPAVANTVYATCPAGTVPHNLLDERLLQPGPIINDTND